MPTIARLGTVSNVLGSVIKGTSVSLHLKNVYLRMILASANFDSSKENLNPMQLRGPMFNNVL